VRSFRVVTSWESVEEKQCGSVWVAVGDRVAVVTWQWDEWNERVIAVILIGGKLGIG
jgi:hypothetical protein